MKDIWKMLGIEPTNDTKAVRRAYAAKVRECHPEDDPEGWQELHNAYESALKLAKLHADADTEKRPQSRPDAGIDMMHHESHAKEASGEEQQNEFEEQFLHIGEHTQAEYAELLKNAEAQADRLVSRCRGRAKRDKRRLEWMDFLSGPEAAALYYSADFWELLGRKLDKSRLLPAKVYKTIREKLVYLKSMLGISEDDEVSERLSETIAVCSKRYNAAGERYVWIVIIGVFVIFNSSIAGSGIFKRHKTADELVNNALLACAEDLNEKYDTDIYNVTDFIPEEITGTAIFYSSELKKNTTLERTAGFKMTSEVNPELEIYVFVIYSQATRKAEEFYVFDNLQTDTVDNDCLDSGYYNPPEYTVYNTYYDGNPEKFFDEEKKVRYKITNTYLGLHLP